MSSSSLPLPGHSEAAAIDGAGTKATTLVADTVVVETIAEEALSFAAMVVAAHFAVCWFC